MIRNESCHQKPIVCDVCEANFQTADLLRQHMQSHHFETVHKCDLCPARFRRIESLDTHRAVFHGFARHGYPEYNRAYSSLHELVDHMRTDYVYEGAVPVQPDSWLNIESDRQHFSLSAANRSSEVPMRAEPVRTESWTDIESDRRHISPTAGNRPSEVPFVYEMCADKRSFQTVELLTQHMLLDRFETVHKCDLCPASFRTIEALDTHRAVIHGFARHGCPEYDRAYSSRQELIDHMRSEYVYKITVPPVQPDSWVDIESDRQHFSPSAGNRSSKVPMRAEPALTESWTDIESDRRHISPTAGNMPSEFPLICVLCKDKKIYQTSNQLTQHMLSHRSERVHKCALCPASYRRLRGLHVHRAVCHGGPQHGCSECYCAYSSRQDLAAHKNTEHDYWRILWDNL